MKNYIKATADNRVYLAPCLRHSSQIPLRGTSDTLGMLDYIAVPYKYPGKRTEMIGNIGGEEND